MSGPRVIPSHDAGASAPGGDFFTYDLRRMATDLANCGTYASHTVRRFTDIHTYRRISRETRQSFRTACRIKELNPNSPVGAMAQAMVQLMDDHREVKESDLIRAYGFTPADIAAHKRAAMQLAKQFAPTLFRNVPDWGA